MNLINEINDQQLDLVSGGASSLTFTAAADGTLTSSYSFGSTSGTYSIQVPAELVQKTGSITYSL